MDGLKQIMYGVTDFARMRAGNAYFVDGTVELRRLLIVFHGGQVVVCEEV